MTINDTELFENTPAGVAKALAQEGMSAELSPDALAALVAFFDVAESEREGVLDAIRLLVCPECGKASCVHGYSDE